MFWTVFKFELAYWFKRPLTLLFFALFFLMAFFSTASDAFLGIATGQIHRNAPFVLATAIGILTGDRSGDHDRDRRHRRAARRAARHRGAAVHDAAEQSRAICSAASPARSSIMLVIYFALPIGLLLGTRDAVGAGRQARTDSRWRRSSSRSS